MSEFHSSAENIALIKECGKYKFFFKTLWLAMHKPISMFNLLIFMLYTGLTGITMTYSLEAMLIVLFNQNLDILILGLGLFIAGVTVNLGMYKYISWFHKKGIYKYIVK